MARSVHIDEHLDELDAKVGDMAALARSMLTDGLGALQRLDRDLAIDVIGRAEGLADMDEDIEAAVFDAIMQMGPVGKPMRRFAAILKLITYLNRLGRYGYEIAIVMDAWPEDQAHVAKMVHLDDMASKVFKMLDVVMDAFLRQVPPDIQVLEALEDQVDSMRYEVWRDCIRLMWQSSKAIEPCSNYAMVARYLERCGDNVCKMAEKLHFVETGERIIVR